MSLIKLSGNPSGTGAFTIAAPNSNTDRTLTLPDATGTVVTDSATQTLTNKTIDALQLTGTLPAINGSALTNLPAPTTAQVLSATAGLSAGDVGTYAYLTRNGNSTTYTVGTTLAGSNLLYSSASGLNSGAGPGGTWRCMGWVGGTPNSTNTTTLWLRIS